MKIKRTTYMLLMSSSLLCIHISTNLSACVAACICIIFAIPGYENLAFSNDISLSILVQHNENTERAEKKNAQCYTVSVSMDTRMRT